MGSVMYACGCLVSSSMFGDCPIMMISLCPGHATSAAIQLLLGEVEEILISDSEASKSEGVEATNES